jgi:hypothetical protein
MPLAASWSWVRQLGTTSLLVYWVHIELVYGRWFGAFKGSLSNVTCGIAAIAVILLMVGLSVLRTRWNTVRPTLLSYFSYNPPRRASGD